MVEKSKKFALASCTREATTAGIEIASSGGNAVDSAVACAFDLLVSDLCMCSIGGGGFAIIRTPDGHVEIIDFFDCMPGLGLDIDYYRKNAKPKIVKLDCGLGHEVMTGHATVGVPGAVKGLELLLNRHGSIPLKEIIQPAIKHAKEGTKFNRNLYDCFVVSAEKIHWSTDYAKNILSTSSGELPRIGCVVKQEDLANTLTLIADYGSDIIYKGDIAQALVKEIKSGGGLLTLEDLNTYEAIVRIPLHTKYRGRDIWTNPPPAVGGATLIEMLNIVSFMELSNVLSPKDISIIGKAQRQALHDKYSRYIDPKTNHEVSNELLSLEYALKCYKKISPPPHTSHLSCVDDSGYAVGITMSMGYDSGVSIPETGIFMANSLGEIDLNPKGFLKARPGDRLISGMTPTIMLNEPTKDLVVLGSAGSSRIPTSLMQVIINLVDLDQDFFTAINSPRFHYEDFEFAYEPDIELDTTLLDDKTKICRFDTIEQFFGGTQCARYIEGNLPQAINDPRRSGSCQTLIT